MNNNYSKIYLILLNVACAGPTYKVIGPYADTGNRALRYGPQSYGYTPDTCSITCKTYTYFALQDNGWCSCDSDWNHVIKYGPSSCGPNGGAWCNYVYQNLENVSE